jgi:hypothetical protein
MLHKENNIKLEYVKHNRIQSTIDINIDITTKKLLNTFILIKSNYISIVTMLLNNPNAYHKIIQMIVNSGSSF